MQAFRSFDLTMMAIANGRERDLEDWRALLASVDGRLTIAKVSQPAGSRMAIIEVQLRPASNEKLN